MFAEVVRERSGLGDEVKTHVTSVTLGKPFPESCQALKVHFLYMINVYILYIYMSCNSIVGVCRFVYF